MLDVYLDSLKAIGIDPDVHDIRFVEDNWESPTLGAWGLGWEVWLDGMEITQFTYFQQCGGIDCRPVSAEITYGLERLAMFVQGVDSVFDITWVEGITYGDVHHRGEVEHSHYNFELANTDMLFRLFEMYEQEALRILKRLCPAAYDYVLKCSHTLTSLMPGSYQCYGAYGFYHQGENMARLCAQSYIEQRESRATRC